MTVSAQSIIRRATDVLQDPTSIRWPISELARWFNDAQRQIVKVRPDAMNTTATMTLAAGARQDLDNASLTPAPAKLIDITRNMAASSAKKVVTKVDKRILDAQIPGWMNLTQAVDIVHFTFDERDPKTFYTYPPATSLAQLEIMYSAFPTDITEPADGLTYTSIGATGMANMSLPDIFADDVLDLILARAYGKDAEYAQNATRESFFMQKVSASLGVEIQGTIAVQPK